MGGFGLLGLAVSLKLSTSLKAGANKTARATMAVSDGLNDVMKVYVMFISPWFISEEKHLS